jgi:hypothetical protein
VEDGEGLTNVLKSLDQKTAFLYFLEQLNGFVLTEIFRYDARPLAKVEVIIIAPAANSAFENGAAGDDVQTLLDGGLDVDVMGLGILENVEKDLHGISLHYKRQKINKCSVSRCLVAFLKEAPFHSRPM